MFPFDFGAASWRRPPAVAPATGATKSMKNYGPSSKRRPCTLRDAVATRTGFALLCVNDAYHAQRHPACVFGPAAVELSFRRGHAGLAPGATNKREAMAPWRAGWPVTAVFTVIDKLIGERADPNFADRTDVLVMLRLPTTVPSCRAEVVATRAPSLLAQRARNHGDDTGLAFRPHSFPAPVAAEAIEERSTAQRCEHQQGSMEGYGTVIDFALVRQSHPFTSSAVGFPRVIRRIAQVHGDPDVFRRITLRAAAPHRK